MQRNTSENNLLSGIISDRDMAKIQPDTLLDAVNVTISPESGSKFVYQSLKSTIPVTSLYQKHYNKTDNVVEMFQKELLTRDIASSVDMGADPVKFKESYFVYAPGTDMLSKLKGLDNYYMDITVSYTDGSAAYVETILLHLYSEGDRFKLGVNPDKYIASIDYQVHGVPVIGYQVGTIDYFSEMTSNESENVGPSEDKIILGTKTFNNITYFIIADPDYKTTPVVSSNNVGITPYDQWNNDSINQAQFNPEPDPEDSSEADRDKLTHTSDITETMPITMETANMGGFSGWGGLLSDTWVYSPIQKTPVGDKIPADGNYVFNVTATAEAKMKHKSWRHVAVYARLRVEREDGSEYTPGYPSDVIPYRNEDWLIGDKYRGSSSISKNGSVTLRDLKKGDQIHLEIQGEARSKGEVKLSLEASAYSTTTHLVETKDALVSDIYSNLNTLLKSVVVTPATSNLHSNGKVEIITAVENLVPGELLTYPANIPSLKTKTTALKSYSAQFSWTKPNDSNVNAYEVQYVVSDNANHQVASEAEWKSLGTTAETSFSVDVANISKKLTDYKYYVWFRVAPRNAYYLGSWSGGYYRFTITKVWTGLSMYRFDNRIDTFKVDSRANDPAVASWAIGSKPVEDSGYEFAIDYSDFRPVDPDGNGVIYGLPPGSYSLYVRRFQSGKYLYAKKSITVDSTRKFEDLELQVSVDMSGDKKVSNFDLLVTVHDPSNASGGYNIFISPYTYLDEKNIHNLVPIATINGDTETRIPLNQVMGHEGTLNIYAVNSNDRDELYIGGLTYLSGRQTKDSTTYFKRIVRSSILVTENFKGNWYNLEIGTFPSPYYGHPKGKLIEVYQPLQNLNEAAFITDQIKLSGNSYVELEIQPVYDGSVNVIFTDGEHAPRVINSGFSARKDSEYEIVRRSGGKESNRYFSETVEISTRLVQTEDAIPQSEVLEVTSSGGCLEVGGYKLLFTLSTVDGNETDFIAETGLIPIMFGDTLGSIQGGETASRTTKAIKVALTGIDNYFNHVNVYIDLATGVNQLVKNFYKVNYQYLIKGPEVGITLTGFEPREVAPAAKLDEQKLPISSIKTIAQIQNRLIVGNFTHEDIDYNKLFKVGTSIIVTPSMGNDRNKFTDFMEAWPGDSEDVNLQTFSTSFYNEKLKKFRSGSLDSQNILDIQETLNLSRTQGYHNPLFVERYAAYWPKETYVYSVSFISNNNFITRPIPITGADYIGMDFNPLMFDNNKEVIESFNQSREESNNPSDGSWFTSGNYTFNNLGVCRFPKQRKPNQVFFPKFVFDLNKMSEEYPGFLDQFKGFFFTRSKRRPDILMQAFLGPVHSTLTDKTVIRDEDPTKYIPTVNNSVNSFKACVPSLFTGLGIMAYEHCVSLSGDDMNWGIKEYNHAGAFIASMVSDKSASESYEDNYQYNEFVDKVPVYKYWLKSGDIFGNFAQAAADFNGKPFGMSLVSSIDTSSYSRFTSTRNILRYLSDVEDVSSLGFETRDEHILQALKPSKLMTENTKTAIKVVPDFRAYGQNTRSPGGFSSLIPFRSLGRIITNEEGQQVLTYLTGAYTPYVGCSAKEELKTGFYDLYPDIAGPISQETLQVIYGSNNNDQHIAITPKMKLKDFINKRVSVAFGTRGDCFITTTVHNVARSLPAISGSPSSNSPQFTGLGQGTTEPNSYRAAAASMSIMATHASNYLNYARHNEIKDEAESASYGGPRTFLPLAGASDSVLRISNGAKQEETTAFNQGFKDNFQGRKYYAVSGSAPFYAKKGANTVAFSGTMSRNSFYNAYRDFDLAASKTYGSEMGEINRMIEYRNNLIVVHSKGTYLVGVNDRELVNGDPNNPVYTKSSNVLSEKPSPLSAKFGSKFPRSVEKSDRFVYGIDADHGKIWRTDGSMFEIISDNRIEVLLKGFLYEMKGKSEIPGERYIASFYDSSKREMVFTIYDKDSQHPNFDTLMQPDVYFFLKNLHNAGLATSGGDLVKSKDLLYHWAEEGWYGEDHSMNHLRREDRIRYVELFLEIYAKIAPGFNSKINNCVTIIYNEDLDIWVTRWSVAPEFMFNHNGTMYSIANKQDTAELPSTTLKFIQDIETGIIAGGSSEILRVNSSLYAPGDSLRRLIWKHEGFNPAIPMFGSFYGKDPVVEFTLAIAQNPTMLKNFEMLTLISNHATPSNIMYVLSGDNPLLNHVMSAPDTRKYGSWEEAEAGYFNHFGVLGDRSVTYPAMFFRQEVRDRRFNPISRANAFYSPGKLEIVMSKGLQPMFISQDAWSRMKFRHFQDSAIKVSIRYESGEEVKVYGIVTTFSA